VGDASPTSLMGVSGMMTSAPGYGAGVAIAVPTDEQNKMCAGWANGDEREMLMRFCRAAN